LKFWHLELTNKDEAKFNLLISDRSGELYTLSVNSSEACKKLNEVLRADYVLFLVDGEKLSGDERHGIKNDVIMLIASLIDSNMLMETHRVGIVLTKYDQVRESKNSQRAEEDFNDLVVRIRARFGSSLREIKSHIIAARPENGKTEPMFGVYEILIQATLSQELKKFRVNAKPTSDRFFINFGAHTEGGSN
jgi:50S ribosomal subunit-associated GTPase HflX